MLFLKYRARTNSVVMRQNIKSKFRANTQMLCSQLSLSYLVY